MHHSTTPFQTERYSRPRHLAASFPFTAHAKNKKNAVAKSPDSLASSDQYSGMSCVPFWPISGPFLLCSPRDFCRAPPETLQRHVPSVQIRTIFVY